MRYDRVMAVDLKPETEWLVLEEIQNGHFWSPAESIESCFRRRRLVASPVNKRGEMMKGA